MSKESVDTLTEGGMVYVQDRGSRIIPGSPYIVSMESIDTLTEGGMVYGIPGQSRDLHSVYGVHRYSDRGLLGVCGSLENPGISIVSLESIDTLTEGGMVYVDPWTIPGSP